MLYPELVKNLIKRVQAIFKTYLKLFFFLIICWCILFLTPAFKSGLNLDNFFADLMYQLKFEMQDKEKLNDEIVIVDLDHKTLWYKERPDYLADIIYSIASKGEAEVIGLDILFDDFKNPDPKKLKTKNLKLKCPHEKDKQPYEMNLACTLNSDEVYNAVLAVGTQPDSKDKFNVEYPLSFLREAAWGVGTVISPTDKDKVTRKAILFLQDSNSKELIFSFPLAISTYIKNNPVISKDSIVFDGYKIPSESKAINSLFSVVPQFMGPDSMYEYIKLSELEKKLDNTDYLKKIFKGKIVLVGSTSKLVNDFRISPYTKFNLGSKFNGLMPGVEYNANVISSLLNKKFYHYSSFIVSILWAIIFISLALLTLVHPKSNLSFIYTLLLLLFSWAIAFAVFIKTDTILMIGTTSLVILIAIPVAYVYKYVTVDKLFGKYVSPDVADLIWKNRDKIVLTGEKRVATVVFSDIRGFTTLSENTDPEIILSLLNEYFERMSKVIYENKGNLNKFIGDGLMMLYGVPLSSGSEVSDAYNAVKSAIEMNEEVVKLNAKWNREGNGARINIGVGIHTGEVIVGNVGSSKRLEYSALGDTVNLSARLEGVNKLFETNVIVSEETYKLLKDMFVFKFLDEIQVKGRMKKVKVYTVTDLKENK